MAGNEFLDKAGLVVLWDRIKQLVYECCCGNKDYECINDEVVTSECFDKAVVSAASKGGMITDVKVNGTSVVTSGIANAIVPTKTSDLNNDSGFTAVSVTQIETTGTNIADIEIDGTTTHLYAQSGGDSLVPVTYSELKAMRDGGTLTKGTQYRITDYVCTTTQINSRVESHPYDIIVVADDESTLNENARACLHEGDTYYSSSNNFAKLESWELKYCIDNDTSRFGWVHATNGKGVVYWLKDERKNEAPYDFKQIQFYRNSTVTGVDASYYFTFSVYDSTTPTVVIEDMSVADSNPTRCRGNIIQPTFNYRNGNTFVNNATELHLNDIIFINTLGKTCNSNVFGIGCRYYTFGDNCSFNKFEGEGSNNKFGSSCQNNIFGRYCSDNTFGNSCKNNTFGNDCDGNTFGKSCSSNIFESHCDFNTLGNSCYGNTLEYNCQYNTFEADCANNTIEDNCQFIDFNKLIYCHILSEVQGTNGSHITITGPYNSYIHITYTTYFGYNSNGVLKTWIPADAV